MSAHILAQFAYNLVLEIMSANEGNPVNGMAPGTDSWLQFPAEYHADKGVRHYHTQNLIDNGHTRNDGENHGGNFAVRAMMYEFQRRASAAPSTDTPDD